MPPRDSYERYELIDRTMILRDQVERLLVDHPMIREDERVMGYEAMHALYDLYQLLGVRNDAD